MTSQSAPESAASAATGKRRIVAAPSYGAWAVARLRAGDPPDRFDSQRMGQPWSEFLGVCRLNGEDRRSAFDRWAISQTNARDILHEVTSIDQSMMDFPEPKAGGTTAGLYVDAPELPDHAALTPIMERAAGDTGRFMCQLTGFIGELVNTLPREFIESAALTVLSIAVARRLVLPTFFDDLYPIFWTLWVAPSTVFHKTTALNQVRRLIRDVMPWLMLPQESSNDRLIQNMAGLKPANWEQLRLWDQERLRHGWRHAAQRGIVVDEASSLFGSFDKEYNRGKIETFLTAFDCEDERAVESNKWGIIYMRHLYMPLLGATTPTSIQFANNNFMWESGFWPRFTVLVPERMFPDEPAHRDEKLTRPPEIAQRLSDLLTRLPDPGEPPDPGAEPPPPPAITCTIEPEAWRHWQKYNTAMSYTFQNPDVVTDNRLRLCYGRLPVKLLRAAMLLAADDWPEDEAAPRIRLPHYARAHQLAETWRLNAHRFVEIMSMPPQTEDLERRVLRTIEHLNAAAKPATTREIQKLTHWPREKLNQVLIQMGEDQILELAPAGNTKVWRPRS